jgi:hypothetical protein
MSPIHHTPLTIAERDQRDAWTMLPQLFAIMDEDNSNTIDAFELMAALTSFAQARHIDMDRRKCMEIVKSVDVNHDHQMDLREFSEFITQYAMQIGTPMFDLVYFMVELMLGEKQGQQNKKSAPEKQSIFDRLMGTLKQEEVSRARSFSRFAQCTAATAHC